MSFTLAVDRNYIVDKVTQSGQVEASAYVPSGISYAEEGAVLLSRSLLRKHP